MDNKPKKKWTSSRLKDKKKELGMEDNKSTGNDSVESEPKKMVNAYRMDQG